MRMFTPSFDEVQQQRKRPLLRCFFILLKQYLSIWADFFIPLIESFPHPHLYGKTTIRSCARHKSGYTTMKKVIVALTALLSASMFTVSFAGKPSINMNEIHRPSNTASEGRGACTHPGCRCQSFSQRPGYYQCMCGHHSYSHKWNQQTLKCFFITNRHMPNRHSFTTTCKIFSNKEWRSRHILLPLSCHRFCLLVSFAASSQVKPLAWQVSLRKFIFSETANTCYKYSQDCITVELRSYGIFWQTACKIRLEGCGHNRICDAQVYNSAS